MHTMRLKGVIKSWNDERGFGFIEPVRGGEEVFFHISAFTSRAVRPQISQRVLYNVEQDLQGKVRARNVELSQLGRLNSPTPRGTGTLVFIPVFVIVYVFAGLLWAPPYWFALIYVLASALTFLVYASDKSSAQRGARRTPESTLHLLSLAGGWPGALLAQQLLRHKTVKAEFRWVFWTTVILNVGAFIGLCLSMSGSWSMK